MENVQKFNDVDISLTQFQWTTFLTWADKNKITSIKDILSFEDLILVVSTKIEEIKSSGEFYNSDDDISIRVPRKLLRYLVFTIGNITYNITELPPVTMMGLKILNKINHQIKEQLPVDDVWFKYNF